MATPETVMKQLWLLAFVLLLAAPARSVQQDTSDDGRWGPSLALDSKSTQIGPWMRQFVSQVRQNWSMPPDEGSGQVVVTFYVSKDGDLEELTVAEAASVEAFNESTLTALSASSPTSAIPTEYPDDRLFVTATFYFNETP